MVKNAIMVDSLEAQLALRDNYFKTIQTLMNGEVPADQTSNVDTTFKPAELNIQTYNHDSIFEKNLLEEQLDLSIQKEDNSSTSLANIHFFRPLKGMVTDGFNEDINHFATDIVGLNPTRAYLPCWTEPLFLPTGRLTRAT